MLDRAPSEFSVRVLHNGFVTPRDVADGGGMVGSSDGYVTYA